jgi:outer membrane lipoprotein-sorting protein
MNKITMNQITLMLGTLFLFTSAHASLGPKEIMIKNEDARKLNDFEARAKLSTFTSGSAKTKEFTLSRKIQKDGIHNNTLTRFHAPAEVRNEGILILENDNGKNDVMLYLPNFKKIRRVESQQQSGSFMGSVFSYSDIATPHVEDFEYKTLGNEKCPGDQKLTCTKIECKPANNDVRDRTGYSKSVVWVRPDNFMIEKAEYYQLDGSLWKTLTASQIKEVDLQNHKWMAHSLSIVNQKNQEKTELQFTNVKVNTGLSDAIFTQQNLQKVR